MEILRSTHGLRRRRKTKKSNGGGSFRIMWEPLRQKISRRKNKTPWLLLANYDQRLREVRTEVRKMPKARADNPSTRGSPLVHLVSVSLHAMVHGYRRAITQLEAKTIPPGPHGFLLKVGRGRFLRKYQRRTSQDTDLSSSLPDSKHSARSERYD